MGSRKVKTAPFSVNLEEMKTTMSKNIPKRAYQGGKKTKLHRLPKHFDRG